MKKFKSTIPQGQGLKFNDKYLESELGEEIWDAMESIINTTPSSVLKGGSVTGASPNAQISDSIVSLNGKILRLSATTGLTYPFYIAEASTVEINGRFGDEIDRPVIDYEFAEVLSSAPVSGDYIEVTEAGEYLTGLRAYSIKSGDFDVKTITSELGTWDMVSNGFIVLNIPGWVASDYSRITGIVDVFILSDTGSGNASLFRDQGAGANGYVGTIDLIGGSISILRKSGGIFDNANYSGAGNRGYITLQYV